MTVKSHFALHNANAGTGPAGVWARRACLRIVAGQLIDVQRLINVAEVVVAPILDRLHACVAHRLLLAGTARKPAKDYICHVLWYNMPLKRYIICKMANSECW